MFNIPDTTWFAFGCVVLLCAGFVGFVCLFGWIGRKLGLTFHHKR